MAGYSGTPLAKKLGLKPGMKVLVINPPQDYSALLGEMPPGLIVKCSLPPPLEAVHLFATLRIDLEKYLQLWRSQLADAGMIWVSWPKKSSRRPTDITEDVIRSIALPLGFVDIKVCAVDEVWSGLKLVIRREERKHGKRAQ